LIEDLLKECVMMCEFNHPNVLKLSGVCLDGGPAPYIIMPFMANGSLLAHLKKERTSLVLDPECHSDDDDDDEDMVSYVYLTVFKH
jgi:serine/threonine protein kinase